VGFGLRKVGILPMLNYAGEVDKACNGYTSHLVAAAVAKT